VDPHAVPLTDAGTVEAPTLPAVRLGAVIPLAVSLGHATTSDLGPTPGNGFETAWADDLAALAELGVTTIRVPLDWSRLQPTRGTVDGSWAEWYRQLVAAGNSHGMACWASLWEQALPRWFVDDGGFADATATARSWPRWVELAAELVGDAVGGWFPMTEPEVYAVARRGDEPRRLSEMIDHLRVGWRDAANILAGGPPVASTVIDAVVAADAVECDVFGLTLRTTAEDRDPERLVRVLHRAADDVATRPLAIAAIVVRDDDPDVHAQVLGAAREAVEDAHADGIAITMALASPAIAATGRRRGLLDADRRPLPSVDTWLHR
jgi:hypothetical protein